MIRPLSLCLLLGLVTVGTIAGVASADEISSAGGRRWKRLAGGADPAIIALEPHEAKRGYVVATTGRGISLSFSPDLIHWQRLGRVFEESVPRWAKREIPNASSVWAPDLSFHDGWYFLYYSVSTMGGQRSVIGLAVNKSLDPESADYRWIDRGKVIESWPDRSDYNAIDPALFVDEGGKWYLFFGSFWTGIKVVEVNPETGKPVAGAKLQAVAARPEIAIEAPYVIHHDDFYYLFVSWDRCCDGAESDYKVAIGRSRKVTGPYVDADGRELLNGGGTLILESDERYRGPGHNSILTTDEGQWIVHHTYDMQNLRARRMLQIRQLRWSPEGWPEVGEPLEIDLAGDSAR